MTAARPVDPAHPAGADGLLRSGDDTDWVQHLLQLARVRLGMELSWVSRVEDDTVVVEAVSGAVPDVPLAAGYTSPLGDSYCVRVLDGAAPLVVQDAALDPLTANLPATAEMGIGSYVGVPLQRSSGAVYGTLCCLNRDPDPHLRLRDAQFLQLLADLLMDLLDRGEDRTMQLREDEATRDGVRALIADGGPDMVLQSIHALPDLRIIGYESLARFAAGTPDVWFARAREVGLGVELELAAVANALEHLDQLTDEQFLTVNVSPDVVSHPGLVAVLGRRGLHQLILEITEHEKVDDYLGLREAMDRWRTRGVRFAVDDAGAGYSGMRQLIELRPEMIKLDRSITRGLDADPARFAMATALAAFAREIGSGLVAEGVETASELAKALELRIPLAQGYHLGRPGERRPRVDLTRPRLTA
ncbi:EAL domain-containing protein [Nakamurella flavida]|uniref:EAL domain-containing protein n=1 Tax=Nakamurella flavida TaxID=363630 RepID=A0A938YFE5_9ACTN|nr:EAL domain-containing protein [Nakamurella flavida]MBM9476676.1 EAL domain-containing protein [Nakamurella flavida]MDP9778886.1 EAL domain-containing protein (putative c-di-GMP-specific phosphodiesterase class I) [Nakamurella flavida]